jgi:hypothetical protein
MKYDSKITMIRSEASCKYEMIERLKSLTKEMKSISSSYWSVYNQVCVRGTILRGYCGQKTGLVAVCNGWEGAF